MATAEHQVGRVVFEIAAPDRSAFEAFFDLVRGHFDASVGAPLQRACDRFEAGEGLVRLARLDVDLGDLDPGSLSPAILAERIGAAVASALANHPVAAPATGEGAPDLVSDLVAFLRTGRMDWPQPGKALAALIAALSALDAAAIGRLSERLRPVLADRRSAERLASQLPLDLVERFLHALSQGRSTAAGGRTSDIAKPRAGSPRDPATDLATEIKRWSGSGAINDVLNIPADGPVDAKAGPTGEIPEPLSPGSSSDPGAADPPARRSPEEAGPTPPMATSFGPEPAGTSPAEPAPAPAGHAVHAAGAVLLHPFLGAFYERLDLLAGPGQFRDPAAQHRAVLLTHYLATGQEDAPEPDTLLFKLLCGLDLDAPLARALSPTAEERSQAESLLGSVIAHWTILGNTSVAGLRETFLLRPGRLEGAADQQRLTVERRGFDVLLDSLPWTISLVRTPFMPAMLSVNWR